MNRVAIVTGAGRGIGEQVALTLAQDGWRLVLSDVAADDPALAYRLASYDELERVADACRALGSDVVTRCCDVRVREEVVELVATARLVGELHATVAAAGVLGGHGLAWELADDVLDRDLAVNYRGVVQLARASVPELLLAGELGRFVAVVSAAGAVGLPRLASYSAAKHAALGYVRSLAADLAPTGVTANAVMPGSTDTALLAATAQVYGLASAADFARHQRTGRLVRPEEVAAAVAWLVSPQASGVTGAALAVDGGFVG